jgi:hypothetical protein
MIAIAQNNSTMQTHEAMRKLNGRINKITFPAMDKRKRRAQELNITFPAKLYRLLEVAEDPSSNINTVVSWLPDGTMFKVHQPKKFRETIIKTYFNQTRFESFTRQVSKFSKDTAAQRKKMITEGLTTNVG